jgi:hypothetical protein
MRVGGRPEEALTLLECFSSLDSARPGSVEELDAVAIASEAIRQAVVLRGG